MEQAGDEAHLKSPRQQQASRHSAWIQKEAHAHPLEWRMMVMWLYQFVWAKEHHQHQRNRLGQFSPLAASLPFAIWGPAQFPLAASGALVAVVGEESNVLQLRLVVLEAPCRLLAHVVSMGMTESGLEWSLVSVEAELPLQHHHPMARQRMLLPVVVGLAGRASYPEGMIRHDFLSILSPLLQPRRHLLGTLHQLLQSILEDPDWVLLVETLIH